MARLTSQLQRKIDFSPQLQDKLWEYIARFYLAAVCIAYYLCGVLVHEVGVLGPAGTSKVLDLHYLRKHRLVKMVLKSRLSNVTLEDISFFILPHVCADTKASLF